ncbi:unnamed protein product, partial [Nesidiocoris tenuis]
MVETRSVMFEYCYYPLGTPPQNFLVYILDLCESAYGRCLSIIKYSSLLHRRDRMWPSSIALLPGLVQLHLH